MTYELACYFKHETDNACLIIDPASGEEIWIPFSQVEERHGKQDTHGRFSGEGTIKMTDWIAKQKGLL
jgi:hypothetical protein